MSSKANVLTLNTEYVELYNFGSKMTVSSHEEINQTYNADIVETIIAFNKAQSLYERKTILSIFVKISDAKERQEKKKIIQMYGRFNLRKLASYWTMPKLYLLLTKMFPGIVSIIKNFTLCYCIIYKWIISLL